MLIVGRRHLEAVVHEFVVHYIQPPASSIPRSATASAEEDCPNGTRECRPFTAPADEPARRVDP
jgi:hypothetical protein